MLADDTGEEQYGNDAGFGDDDGYEDGGQPEELSFDDLADAAASGQPNYDAMNAEAPQVKFSTSALRCPLSSCLHRHA